MFVNPLNVCALCPEDSSWNTPTSTGTIFCNSQEIGEVSHWWKDYHICLPVLRRTPPVCGYGYHGGMAFGRKACPLKSQSESKAFQKRVFLLYLVFLGYLVFQSSLQPHPRTGGRGWSDPCKPTWMAWVQGVVQGLPGAPKQCFSLCEFVKLWVKWFLITKKPCFFFLSMAALFCILVHSWGIGACHQKKFGQNWCAHGPCSSHRSFLPRRPLTLLGDLQQTGVSGVTVESPESLECLELTMSCKFFSRPVSPFYKVEISRQTSEKLQPTDIKQVCTRIWTHPS